MKRKDNTLSPCLLLALSTVLGLFLLPDAPARAQISNPWKYPSTFSGIQTDMYFDTEVADPYRWLENDNSPETAKWVEAENKITSTYLDHIPYRAQIRARLKEIVNYARYSLPFQKAGYIFFRKNSGLQNQSVVYVQKGLEGQPEMLLDPNTFSLDGTARLTDFAVSKDGKYAAYAVSQNGSDWEEIRILDVATRQREPETLQWVKYSSVAWRGDGFYYSRFPTPAPGKERTEVSQNQKVYYHKIGTAQTQDVLVYEDPIDPTWSANVDVTKDEKFAILTTRDPSKRGNTLFYRLADQDDKPFLPIVPTISDNRYDLVDNSGDDILIRTNAGAPNGQVVAFDTKHPDRKLAKLILPEQPQVLQSVTTAGGKLFATYLVNVSSRVFVFKLDGTRDREVKMPDLGSVEGFDGDKDADYVFYTFASYQIPTTIYRTEINSGKTSVFRAPELVNYKSDDYDVQQQFIPSKDGTKIPVFLVYRKGLKKNGDNPTLITGYGGFNVNLTPSFSSFNIAWLEQGGIYVFANLRGGGEFGEKWHMAGMGLKKQNVFDDCIAVAEYLIKEKYTSPRRLAVQGGSNGGLMVGAVINQRPELFSAAVPQVGVMDMLRFQKFTAGKYWVAEYGSSDNQRDFDNLYRYSPLHNIRQGVRYPATLILTADHDDRVVPAHSFKYAAAMQKRVSSENPVLIRIDTKAGHSGSSLAKAIDETADVFAFLFYTLGVTPKF